MIDITSIETIFITTKFICKYFLNYFYILFAGIKPIPFICGGNQKGKNMKTFNDLVFEAHRHSRSFSTQATMDFENGYGISVITGESAYSSESEPYEVAVLFGGHLCYTTPITSDVIGYQTAQEVTNIMKQIQELP